MRTPHAKWILYTLTNISLVAIPYALWMSLSRGLDQQVAANPNGDTSADSIGLPFLGATLLVVLVLPVVNLGLGRILRTYAPGVPLWQGVKGPSYRSWENVLYIAGILAILFAAADAARAEDWEFLLPLGIWAYLLAVVAATRASPARASS